MEKVLVTGAGGTIGSALVERMLCADEPPKEIRLLGISEHSIWDAMRRLEQPAKDKGVELVPILASVTSSRCVDSAIAGCDTVFHCAAHKHVPLCERNMLDAIRTNVGGTVTVTLAAKRANAAMVHLSTDKAVFPVSVMGKTKRVAELYLLECMRKFKPRITIGRLVNVEGSSGSVLPLWNTQAEAGQPITLTDPECRRYFITQDDAAEYLLSLAGLKPGLYLPRRFKVTRMGDLAATVAQVYSAAIKVIGLRPGERLEEPLHYDCARYTAVSDLAVKLHEKAPEPGNMVALLLAYAKQGYSKDSRLLLDMLTK